MLAALLSYSHAPSSTLCADAGDHFDRLAAAAASYPNKFFLGTEATYELTRLGGDVDAAWVRDGVWARGEGYAHAIIGDLLSGSSGWIDWNILLDTTGGASPAAHRLLHSLARRELTSIDSPS